MAAVNSPWGAADAALHAAMNAASAAGASNAPKNAESDARDDPHYISAMTREEIDAKLAAATARTEAFEARVDLSFAKMEARISHLPSTAAMITTAFTTGVAVVGLILGVIAFGGDRFDGGIQATTASVQTATDALNISKQNAQQINALTTRIDSVLNAVARQAPSGAPPEPGR